MMKKLPFFFPSSERPAIKQIKTLDERNKRQYSNKAALLSLKPTTNYRMRYSRDEPLSRILPCTNIAEGGDSITLLTPYPVRARERRSTIQVPAGSCNELC